MRKQRKLSLRFASLIAASWLLSGSLVAKEFEPLKIEGVVRLPMEGVIHGGTAEMVHEALREATAKRYGLAIELDTPGGLLDATREMIKSMLNATVPIFVFVGPSGSRAGSAGTFITLAGHIAAMAPGTNIGAAHPITISGKDPEADGNKHLAQKIENDTLAFIETIAEQRGRNVEWAKSAVKVSSSITEKKAAELKVIDFVADNLRQTIDRADGMVVNVNGKKQRLQCKGVPIASFELTFGMKVLNILASPSVMFLLLTIAGLGIYVEFSNPGLIFPSAIAGIALVLMMFASRVLPINYMGVLLLFLGIGMLIAEVFVASFGLLLAGGLLCFFLGAQFLFDPSEIDVAVPMVQIWGATITIGVIAIVIGYFLVRSMRGRQTAGSEGIVGMQGSVLEVRDDGSFRVFVNGEYWNARLEVDQDSEGVQKDDAIEVVQADSLTLVVRRRR